MDDNNPINSLVGRSLAGAFAGSVFGAAAQLIFFWDGPPREGIKLPWEGALIGATLVGAMSILVGSRELPGWLRKVAIGFLTGVVGGVLAGAFIFAPIMTTLEIGNDSVFREKVLAVYQQIGIAAGAILGGLFGLVAGIAACYYDSRKRNGSGYEQRRHRFIASAGFSQRTSG
jgi:hypothetical protein